MPIALVTGASSGIGEALAKRLSQVYLYDLVIVARSTDKLNQLAQSLPTKVTVVTADLATNDGVQRVEQCLQSTKFDMVINNAGFGLIGPFDTTDMATEQSMIDVNVVALHRLFKVAVQTMKETPNAHILNVGSIAGYVDGPYMSTYFATKNYVRALTRAVDSELKAEKAPLRVHLLAPGPVHTNFGHRANQIDHMNGQAQGLVSLSPDVVAKDTLHQLFKNRLDIIPSFKMRLVYRVMRLLPSSLIRHFLKHYYR